MYKSTLLALEDCLFLAQQNIDSFSNTLETLKSSDDALQSYQVDDLQTLLSATLTNQETCLDGLMLASDSSIKNALLVPISNGTMHYSVGLALFTHGWPLATKRGEPIRCCGPNGGGNFTNINDAVAAAPTNTVASKGYFLIYVVAGVYNEYVSIASNKKYLMMIGEGINQTVITGNRSVDDGWTTFNSATFSKPNLILIM
ncbi:unnamed protein product [Dovyalis caffra]|uniref:Pectinesterase n=1 Tax=Dovyalis caffra TaxID=77055 RepID=A0AAV1RYE2_9ROSI|nr:unnamed protein product [Dovyalis caffra]